ncbi:peptidase, S49 (Protease IV) family protein [Isoalcanivorax pacificus W11-5]|uniref:Peptidase, S49 (Protease IV) family protein n=1 Tax=Isoalcanivorax pacificus W11-5 TaxID=391936 RepID=A0A0B4XNP1_9GAMM|nr:S49 family peptidase [Isoalcanivorax pacificus]AJD48093.1 peptidase, S49 (Protease IV) family protein [Isoalcanivorax pacificus W11-5]
MDQYNDNRGAQVSPPQSNREWQLIEKLVLSMQDEQRKQRRWSIFFRAATLGYLVLVLLMFLPLRAGFSGSMAAVEPHTALVDVSGVIADGAEANADAISQGLRRAFEAEQSKAVMLRINSPGGSPVQSGYVYNEIMRLKAKYPEKKVYAVITDVGASGAYYIAAAADEIYVDPASIVGSIGVIMAGFGFTEAIEKLGVERRVQTSGENKALMDPFQPQKPEQTAHFQGMLDQIHQQFIDAVKAGRGDRLQVAGHPELFSGLVWSGEEAVRLGLADGTGSPGQVAREVVGEEEIVDYSVLPHPLERLLGGFGVSIGKGVGQMLGVDGWSLR